nr:ATP-binding protein [Clostridium sp. MCC353]
MDLSSAAASQPITILAYGWEYYSQQLLSPGEFEGRKPSYLYLGQYGGFEGNSSCLFPHGCATYRLNILLPQEVREYALELPEIYSSSRIWINGRLVSDLGNVSSENIYPSIRTGIVTFQASGNAELVVQAADHSHYYSGMVYPPAFGTPQAVSDLIFFRFLRTCIMVISSCTIGIMYLTIGLKTGTERKQMVLFALICHLFSIHIMYPLFHLFGAGYWSYHLEDVSFYLFLLAVTALHCNLCGINGKSRMAVLISSSLVSLISLLVPALFLKHQLNYMLAYSIFLDCYKLILFGWLIITALFNKKRGEPMTGPLLASLCAIALSLMFQTTAPVFEPVRFGWPVENASFLFVLSLAGGLWFNTVNAYAGRAALTENIRLMKKQFLLQEENYQVITGNFEEIRRMRHDLRHHLNTIIELAGQKQYDEMELYIRGCKDNTEQASMPTLCENHAASAVLNYYIKIARQKGVPMELKVSLPPELKLESWNLGILFGNLLENAIDAAEMLPKEKRIVKVYSKISKGNLLLTVKNTWNGVFSSYEDQITSTKHEGKGIGLASVRELVEQNGGQFYLNPGGEEFEVSIVLWKQI